MDKSRAEINRTTDMHTRQINKLFAEIDRLQGELNALSLRSPEPTFGSLKIGRYIYFDDAATFEVVNYGHDYVLLNRVK